MAKQTPEKKIKAKVKVILKKLDAYYHMPVQTGYGAPTLDFICCINGRFVAIETKADRKLATKLQLKTARDIMAADGIALLVNESNIDTLESWLLLLTRK